jgi:hypothetical protein
VGGGGEGVAAGGGLVGCCEGWWVGHFGLGVVVLVVVVVVVGSSCGPRLELRAIFRRGGRAALEYLELEPSRSANLHVHRYCYLSLQAHIHLTEHRLRR